jgi:hypothetical protein
MAETSREIRGQLEDTRARIGTTIAALQHKVHPQRVVEDHPLALVAVAFGTGLLVATSGVSGRTVGKVAEQVRHGAGRVNDSAGSALDGVVDAVIGSATKMIATTVMGLLEVALGAGSANTDKSTSRSPGVARVA